MKTLLSLALVWLTFIAPAFADSSSVPGGGISYSGSGATLSTKLVPFTDVGLACNDVSDESAALQTAINNAAAGGYTLVGSPSMKCKVSQNITVSAVSSVQGNGMTFDCTANANTSGACITLNASTSPPSSFPVEPPNWSGITLLGPAWTSGQGGNYASTTTLNGIAFTGTNSYQLANLLVTNLTVIGFYNNIDIGPNQGYIYVIKFVNAKSYSCINYGVDLSAPTVSGENISFLGGVFSNCHSSAVGTATGASSSGTTVNYTPGTGTFAVGQTVTVTGGTGTLSSNPTNNIIATVGTNSFTLVGAPSVALSGATISAGFQGTSVHVNSTGFDVQFDQVSMDYSDWLVRVDRGIAHFSHDHFESSCAITSNGALPLTNCNPYIWLGAAGNGVVTVADSMFYQPVTGIAGGGVVEPSGGRPFMVQQTGAWNSVVFSGMLSWQAQGDNHLTTLFKNGTNQRSFLAHVETGSGANPTSFLPSLGVASPTYNAGNFTSYTSTNPLPGFTQTEVNYYRNPTFTGAVAGAPGTLPTNVSIGNLQGLSQQVLGVSYATGRPQLQVRFFGTATAGAISLKWDSPNTNILPTQQYDNWLFSMGVQVIANPGANLPTLQMGYQGFKSDNVTQSEIASATAVTPTLYRQVLKYPISITNSLTASFFPYTPITVAAGAYDFTLGFDIPEVSQVGAPVTQPNTSLAGSASSTSYVPGNYGVNTVAANCDTLSGVSPTNNQCLSMWGNGTAAVNGPAFSLPVQSGAWVYARAYVSIPSGSVTNGLASLYYTPYDANGNALTGAVIGTPVVCASPPCAFQTVSGWVYMPPAATTVRVYPYLPSTFNGTAIFDHVEASVE